MAAARLSFSVSISRILCTHLEQTWPSMLEQNTQQLSVVM